MNLTAPRPGGIVPAVTTGQRQWGRLALALHVIALVGGFFVLLYCNKDQWFFGDEWDFIGHRGVFGAERSLWAPHTEHWSTLPILIYRGLYARYGLLTYVPYVAVLLLLHVAVSHLLWRLLLRANVDPLLATALSAVFMLLGAGSENLLWAFQIGFIGSIALGLATLLLVNHDGAWGWRDVAGWGVSIAGLMFAGLSVTMVAAAGLTVLMRRGWRQAALTVSVPGIVYLIWFSLIGDQNIGSSERTLNDFFRYPEYIWNGLRSAAEQTVGFPGAGAIIVLGLAAFLLHRAGLASGPAAPAFACAFGALMQFAIIAAGRATLGFEEPAASRYVYIVVALALPAIGVALNELVGTPGPPGLPGSWSATPGRRAVVCLVLLLVGVHNGGALRERSKDEKQVEQRLKAHILAAAQLVSSPAVVLGGHPEPKFSPDIEVDDLRRMHRDGKLPAPERITAEDRLEVAAVLQYAVSEKELATPFTAPVVDGVVGATDQSDGAGCLLLFPTGPAPEVHFVGGSPMSVRVTTLLPGELTGYLRIFTPTVRTSAAHFDKVRAGVPVYVNVTAMVDQVALRVPASGTTEVCGVL
jgi:hypothetical protein